MAKLLAIGLAVACACSTFASAQDSKSSDQPSKYVWYSVEKVNSGKFGVYTMGPDPTTGQGLMIRRHDLTSFRKKPA